MKKAVNLFLVVVFAIITFVPASFAADEVSTAGDCHPDLKNRLLGGCKPAEGFMCCPGTGGITIIIKI